MYYIRMPSLPLCAHDSACGLTDDEFVQSCGHRSHIAFSRNWVTLCNPIFVFISTAIRTEHLPANANQNKTKLNERKMARWHRNRVASSSQWPLTSENIEDKFEGKWNVSIVGESMPLDTLGGSPSIHMLSTTDKREKTIGPPSTCQSIQAGYL